MKKKILTPIESEIEFDLPCYIKYGDSRFYKIPNETELVTVNIYDFATHIEITILEHCDPFGNKGWEFTTKEEFQKAFDIALDRISTLTEFPNIHPETFKV